MTSAWLHHVELGDFWVWVQITANPILTSPNAPGRGSAASAQLFLLPHSCQQAVEMAPMG